jgi:hypothetical protein
MKQMLAFAITALCAVSASVLGAQPAQSGQNIFTCEVTVLPLEEGHALILWKGKESR